MRLPRRGDVASAAQGSAATFLQIRREDGEESRGLWLCGDAGSEELAGPESGAAGQQLYCPKQKRTGLIVRRLSRAVQSVIAAHRGVPWR